MQALSPYPPQAGGPRGSPRRYRSREHIETDARGPKGTVLQLWASDPQRCFSPSRNSTPERGTPQRAGPSPDFKNAGRSRTPGRLRRAGVHPSDSRSSPVAQGTLAFRTVPLQRSHERQLILCQFLIDPVSGYKVHGKLVVPIQLVLPFINPRTDGAGTCRRP